MRRRTLLRNLSAAGAIALTGCVTDGSSTDEATEPDESTDTRQPTDTETPADTPTEAPVDTRSDTAIDSVDSASETPTNGGQTTGAPDGTVDQSFEITASNCGGQVDDASITFDGGVTVTGTIWGNNACYTAEIRDTRYDADADSFVVVIAAEEDAGTDTMCAQCITEIGYEASFTFDGDLPGEVVVDHVHGTNRTTVASAER